MLVCVCAETCMVDGKLPAELDQLNPELIDRVLYDVVEKCQDVSWDSIVGLEPVKKLIQFNMVLPMRYSHLFEVHTIQMEFS